MHWDEYTGAFPCFRCAYIRDSVHQFIPNTWWCRKIHLGLDNTRTQIQHANLVSPKQAQPEIDNPHLTVWETRHSHFHFQLKICCIYTHLRCFRPGHSRFFFVFPPYPKGTVNVKNTALHNTEHNLGHSVLSAIWQKKKKDSHICSMFISWGKAALHKTIWLKHMNVYCSVSKLNIFLYQFLILNKKNSLCSVYQRINQ